MAYEWELPQALALTPIDNAACACQLADFRNADRLAARLLSVAFCDFELFDFRVSFFDVTRSTRTPVRTKHLPLVQQSAPC
jgi:hypothetical protein